MFNLFAKSRDPLDILFAGVETERLRLFEILRQYPSSMKCVYTPFTWIQHLRGRLEKAIPSIQSGRLDAGEFLRKGQRQLADMFQDSQSPAARESFGTLISLFAKAEAVFQFDAKAPLIEPETVDSSAQTLIVPDKSHDFVVTIPSFLLYQARACLLPAERMAVAPGLRTEDGIRLVSLIDVTGEGSAVSVAADPNKLVDSVVMMDKAGCMLGAWLHTHPGFGPVATTPSDIDRRQDADWLEHYPETMIGIILVADGWIRLFGKAIENNIVTVNIVGNGILQEKEHGTYLYRLSE